MKLDILFLISIVLLGFGLESYAIEFTDNTGYIPNWATGAEQEQIILECESGDYPEKDADWCLEYLESLLVELKNDPIIQEIESRSNSELVIPAPFVDTSKDPQYYIDRYNNEPKYKEWFDDNYPQYSSIYQAVGLEEPTVSETASTNIEENTCPDGEEWIESAEICMMSEPVMDEEPTNVPTCGKGTILQDGICVIDESYKSQTTATKEKSSKGGGCLIATATYGTELAPQVQLLREIRDGKLLNTESGSSFMESFNDFYYSFSPYIADMERESPVFKEAVKIVITPMISSLSILNYVDMDSEESVFGYGISLIILNLGMYVGLPVFGIIIVRKQF